MILEHFEHRGRDELRASALYAEDAVLEFPRAGSASVAARTSSRSARPSRSP